MRVEYKSFYVLSAFFIGVYMFCVFFVFALFFFFFSLSFRGAVLASFIGPLYFAYIPWLVAPLKFAAIFFLFCLFLFYMFFLFYLMFSDD
ncbi:hypothetical protein TCDM_01163 [Trypanosoma cruzi Dm28c]|uniref:Uncharacterized protein n=1 Tax=Trypanosoma cruzi Dm28c TaxID=1416333 RepID=V5BQG0_TRYCR|nr:hypothetical protein TCDM_01163 [Trypanosoma cruzi Dm28c]